MKSLARDKLKVNSRKESQKRKRKPMERQVKLQRNGKGSERNLCKNQATLS